MIPLDSIDEVKTEGINASVFKTLKSQNTSDLIQRLGKEYRKSVFATKSYTQDESKEMRKNAAGILFCLVISAAYFVAFE